MIDPTAPVFDEIQAVYSKNAGYTFEQAEDMVAEGLPIPEDADEDDWHYESYDEAVVAAVAGLLGRDRDVIREFLNTH